MTEVPEGTVREPYVIWLDDARNASTKAIGGKLASLAELISSAFGVPPGFGVTTSAYRRFVHGAGLEEIVADARHADRSDLAALEEISQRITAAIQGAPLPDDLDSAIRRAYEELEERASEQQLPVAVRSSGVAEDLQEASFAGQYETYLWIVGPDRVCDRIRACWSGLFGPRVLSYHAAGEGLGGPPAMAVGVQQMVMPRAAGVMFTLDPLNGDRSKVVIESAWGLGESVVGGEVTPDRYRVDKVTLDVLSREISVKEAEYRFDPEDRTVALRAVPENRRAESSLTDQHVAELVTLGKRIERHRGAPMDIEWAVDERDRVHVLQVRPETVWSQRGRDPVAPEADSAVQRVLARFMAGAASGRGGGKERT